jgi:DNA-binding CsgD family transcriptional regulator
MLRAIAKGDNARSVLRSAAIQIDRAHGRFPNDDREEVHELWKGVVMGRWSKIDGFDHNGRRYLVVHSNPSQLKDPRGLTEREAQVVTYASLGESNKLISYRLGINQPKVSSTLRSAMRKLGVQTCAQLVERMRGFQSVA